MSHAMRSIRRSLRRFVQGYGWDIHRVGANRLGNNHFADITHFCGAAGVRRVFDIGANAGQSATYFLEEFPEAEIWSFEPFPDAFQRLNAALGGRPRVRTFNLGFAEKEGTRRMFIQKGSELNSLLHPSSTAAKHIAEEPVVTVGECEIQLTTLDAFCRAHSVDQIDLLKIDTQGAELMVLSGAEETFKRRAVRTIFLEVNFVPLYDGQPTFFEIFSRLETQGFGFVGFYDQVFAQEGYLKWTDALFVRRD